MTPTNTLASKGNGKGGGHPRFSAQALARIRAAHRKGSGGRPPKYPEVGILARRAEVSYIHAYKVMRGQAKSACLTKMLKEIRRELRAKAKAGKRGAA
jgi:hypothetical protein